MCRKYRMVNKVLNKDVPAAVGLLKDIASQATQLTSHVHKLQERVESGELSTAKGVSFLEVKYQSLLSYLINLTHLMLRKSQGKKIEGDPSIARLVEIRTVLEKMKPIDQKLKYQIDKLIRTAATGVGANDPLRLKPNPANLASKLEDEEEDSDSDEEEDDGQPKKYAPPRIVAMHYDGDETEKERKSRLAEKNEKRLLSSSIMQDLHDQHYDGPQEITDSSVSMRDKQVKEFKEREAYEEDNFVRLSLTKEQKHALKKSQVSSGLQGLTSFGNLSTLYRQEDGTDDGPKKKRKRSYGKGKKKGFKKRKY